MYAYLSQLFERLAGWHADWLLLAASVVLILIDYFFRTDVPAHLAYFCVGAGTMLRAPLSLWPSVAVGLAVWILLELLHRQWFGKYLENVPRTVPRAGDQSPSQANVP